MKVEVLHVDYLKMVFQNSAEFQERIKYLRELNPASADFVTAVLDKDIETLAHRYQSGEITSTEDYLEHVEFAYAAATEEATVQIHHEEEG